MTHVNRANESFEFLISHKMPLNTFRKKKIHIIPGLFIFKYHQSRDVIKTDASVSRDSMTSSMSPTHLAVLAMLWFGTRGTIITKRNLTTGIFEIETIDHKSYDTFWYSQIPVLRVVTTVTTRSAVVIFTFKTFLTIALQQVTHLYNLKHF